MSAGIYTPSGYRIGRVVLSRWHSTASDTFCAVTIRRNHAPPRFLNAKIKRVGQQNWQEDPTPNGTHWAGPVYIARQQTELTAFGRIGDRWTQIWWTGPNWVCWEYQGFPKECGDLSRMAEPEPLPPPGGEPNDGG
jgi:hypothetical protein